MHRERARAADRDLEKQAHRFASANLPERTLVEVPRRTNVIGRFPGETSALSLIWAVLEFLQPRVARSEESRPLVMFAPLAVGGVAM